MEPWREELYHHGIKGQKWGIRRYQNDDGTLTAAGRRRLRRKWYEPYNEATENFNKAVKGINKKYDNADLGYVNGKYTSEAGKKYAEEISNTWNTLYSEALIKQYGENAFGNGRQWVKSQPFYNQYKDVM